MTPREICLGLLISGSGTTMEALLKECTPTGRLWRIAPGCVIASTPEAAGIAKAQRYLHRSNVGVIERKQFSTAEAFGEAVIAFCRERRIDWLGQYGWMPLTPPNVIEAFEGRMINQHPGPVRPGAPGFGGKGMHGIRVHDARLRFVRATGRDFWTEATAQRVHPRFDEGQVLRVGRVTIAADETAASLQKRVLPVEHETQLRTLQDVMLDRLTPAKDLPDLVRPGEEDLLEQCKREAIAAYP